MPDWMAENRDYFFFVLACLSLFGVLETWLRRRKPHGKLPWIAWPVLAVLLVTGCYFVESGGRSESRRIQDFLQGGGADLCAGVDADGARGARPC